MSDYKETSSAVRAAELTYSTYRVKERRAFLLVCASILVLMASVYQYYTVMALSNETTPVLSRTCACGHKGVFHNRLPGVNRAGPCTENIGMGQDRRLCGCQVFSPDKGD